MLENKPASFQEKLTAFVIRFRIPLGILAALIVLGIIAVVIGTEVFRNRQNSVALELHELESSVTEWQSEQGEDADLDPAEILAEINSHTFPGGSYAQFRQHFLRATVYETADDTENSMSELKIIADAKGYLADIAMLKLGLLYEETGDIDSAKTILVRLVEERDSPHEPRVIFTIARIHEQQGDFASATEYYNRLLNDYSASGWANFAQNRLIALEVEGKVPDSGE